jgi:hypothetical protein
MRSGSIVIGTDRWNVRLEQDKNLVTIAHRQANKTLAVTPDSAQELIEILGLALSCKE